MSNPIKRKGNKSKTIKKCFGVNVGYSDHTCGVEASIAAVVMGAQIIEKHITLDKNMQGPDHKASIEPIDFKKMVNSIRNIEKSLGDGVKKPSEKELTTRKDIRKSILAAEDIKKGDLFTEDNLTTKRPFNGISPVFWDDFIGKKSKFSYLKDEEIR